MSTSIDSHNNISKRQRIACITLTFKSINMSQEYLKNSWKLFLTFFLKIPPPLFCIYDVYNLTCDFSISLSPSSIVLYVGLPWRAWTMHSQSKIHHFTYIYFSNLILQFFDEMAVNTVHLHNPVVIYNQTHTVNIFHNYKCN